MDCDDLGPTAEPSGTGTRRVRRYRVGIAAATTAALALGGAVVMAGAAHGASGAAYVAPYVDMSNSQEGVLNTAIASDGLRAYTAAFVIGEGCNQEWGDTLPVGNDPAIDGEISAAKAAGASVIVSSGGAAGEPLSFTCTTQSTIDAGYKAILSDYGASSLDFDIEGAAIADTASIERTFQAMKDIGASFSVTIPVLPSGMTNYGVALVQDAQNMGITIPVVNLMTMDYYEGTSVEMGQGAIQAAQNTLGQLKAINSAYTYANIGITPMIGVNDDGSTFTLADASTVTSWAAQNGVGRLAFWSVDRDQACPGGSTGGGASSTCSGVSQSTGAFTAAFLSQGSGNPAPPPTSSSPSPSPTKSSSSPSPSPSLSATSGGSGTCAPAWSATTTYYTGTQVSYNGIDYTATYVSTGVQPGSAIAWNIWASNGSC